MPALVADWCRTCGSSVKLLHHAHIRRADLAIIAAGTSKPKDGVEPLAGFGIVPLEVPLQRHLEALAPEFLARLARVFEEMVRAGHDPFVFESLRSHERQEYLFGFGRSYDDGRGIVTNSGSGFETWHFYGLAVDIVSSQNLWNAPVAFWRDLGAAVRRYGLAWGGDWPNFPDKPHVQFGPPMPQSPTASTVDLFRAGGNAAVWKHLGVD